MHHFADERWEGLSVASGIEPNIAESLAGWAKHFELVLEAMLAAEPSVPSRLAEAVRYAVQGGGKRVRPFIVTRMCELCGGTPKLAAPAAVAIECIHAFSLVHDDLPAMDNDDFRRGRPTCHKVYGEAVAILAGDALVALAFELLATRIDDSGVGARAVVELASGTGWAGMVGGQVLDVMNEDAPPDLRLVDEIHRLKTGRLFVSAARLGAICAKSDNQRLEAATEFGRQLGRAFQIVDDILDVTGDAALMGKAVAKDADAGKQTYPAAAGLTAARRAAEEAVAAAVAALEIFGPAADDLRQLARFVLERKK